MKEHQAKKHVKNVSLSKHIPFHSASEKGKFTKIVNALGLTYTQAQEIHQIYSDYHNAALDNQKTMSALEDFDKLVQSTQFLPEIDKKILALYKLQEGMSLLNQVKTALPLLSYCLRLKLDDAQHATFENIWVDILRGAILKDGARGFSVEKAASTLKPSGRVIEGITIYKTEEGYVQFTCGANICVDGAPDAYGPDDTGSDYTASAGHSDGDKRYKRDNKGGFVKVNGEKVLEFIYEGTDWWGVWTDNGKSNGQPVLNETGKYYISMSSYVYEGQPDNVQKRYVNANNISFAVLSRESMGPLGLKIGDLVYVYNKRTKKGKWCGFLETRRKDDDIGEISAACADAIGVPSSPRIGGQNGDIVYTFYPNTGPTGRFRDDKEVASYIFRNGKNIEEGKSVDKNPRIP